MSEIEVLEDRIDELEFILGLTAVMPAEVVFHLRNKGVKRPASQMMGLLLKRTYVPWEAAAASLFGMRAEAEEPKHPLNYCRVLVCELRKALKPFGIEIKTAWGKGWFMDQSEKAKLLALWPDYAAAFRREAA